MISFCTFGVVQSFGVYQDYYTVSMTYRFAPNAQDLIPWKALFFDRENTVRDQLDRICSSLFGVCGRPTCRKIDGHGLLPSYHGYRDAPLSIIVSGTSVKELTLVVSMQILESSCSPWSNPITITRRFLLKG